MQIFLDLDGVIRDFVAGAIKHFELKATYEDVIHYNWLYERVKKVYGLSKIGFWESLDRDFWLSLPLTDYALEMLALMLPYKPTILTAPTLNSAGPTQAWIRKNLPDYFHDKRYLIGPAKASCAHKGALLIDDKGGNISSFIAAGGYGLLFPRPWNQLHGILEPVEHIALMLREMRVQP
jgi:hypothetical protein